MEESSFQNIVKVVETVRDWSSAVETFQRVLRETERGLNELSQIISELKDLNGSNNKMGG
jgi:hypothetical protein